MNSPSRHNFVCSQFIDVRYTMGAIHLACWNSNFVGILKVYPACTILIKVRSCIFRE